MKPSRIVLLGIAVLVGLPLAGFPLYLVVLETTRTGFGFNRPSIVLVVSIVVILAVVSFLVTKGEISPRNISDKEHKKLIDEYLQSRHRVMIGTIIAMIVLFWFMKWFV
mgnify:CR=1 FL=1